MNERTTPPLDWATFAAGVRTSLVGLGYSPDTVRTYGDAVNALAAWGRSERRGPCDLTTGDLLAFMGSHPEWSRATRHSRRSGLRAAYRWAVIAGHMTHNPAADLPPVRQALPAPHPTPRLAYESAIRASDRQSRIMVRLALECGLRRGEVAQIHPRRDILGERGDYWLTVHGKGSKERTVPLPDDLAAAVLMTAGPGYLFPGRTSGHLAPHTVGRRISDLLPEGWAMHSLRHRFATDAYQARDGDLLAVQQLLGHASPNTTQRYVLVESARLRAAVDAGRALRSAV